MKNNLNSIQSTCKELIVKRKQVIILKFALALILFSKMIQAANISESQARIVAENFFKAETGLETIKAILAYKQADDEGTVAFYIFHIQNHQGFVMVMGNDNLKPIAAYSTESNFNIHQSSYSGLGYFLNKTYNQVKTAIEKNVIADAKIQGLWNAYLTGSNIPNRQTTDVSELLKTKWGQGDYKNQLLYNGLCPYNSDDHEFTYTGCTATAMAQIMKYWNYPEHGTGSHSYHCFNHNFWGILRYDYGIQGAEFESAYYHWTEMPETPIDENVVDSSTAAIDTLMFHCGVATETMYGDSTEGGSSSNLENAMNAYINYFGYSSSLELKVRYGHLISDWKDMLKAELDAGRPVQYRGGGNDGGHTWIIDGYSGSDYFHMNWGWDGLSNGYYTLGDLTPYDGIEETDLNIGEKALIGITPPNLSECYAHKSLNSINFPTHMVYTWQASDYLTSSASILPTMNITFTAGNYIKLTDGFSASEFSNFTAKIAGCNAPRNAGQIFPESASENSGQLFIFPNPIASTAQVRYLPHSDGMLQIEIIDLRGKAIINLSFTKANAGTEIEIPINLEGYSTGIYFLRVTDSNSTSVSKIIKS